MSIAAHRCARKGGLAGLSNTRFSSWRSLDGPELEREFRFHPERKWRADLAHIASCTLIETEGGIYIQGRHNRADGFIAEIEKYLEAFLAGWAVVRLTATQISTPTVERLIAAIRARGIS